MADVDKPMTLIRIPIRYLGIMQYALGCYLDRLKKNPSEGLDSVDEVQAAYDWLRERRDRL